MISDIFWLGSAPRYSLNSLNPAMSLASIAWQSRLVQELGLHVNVQAVSSLPSRAYPFGNAIVSAHPSQFITENTLTYSYVNLPMVRDFSKAKKIKSVVTKAGSTDSLVVSYNPYYENRASASQLSLRLNIPWIEICADAYENKPSWYKRWFDKKLPDGYVFLSAEAYRRCPSTAKLLLHGGVEKFELATMPTNISAEKESTKKVQFLYSGSFEYWSGISILLEAFRQLPPDINANLTITGYGALSEKDKEIIKASPRIENLGTVCVDTLHQLRLAADVFVNPRPNLSDNTFNFPSKLLEYFSYQTLVISTLTPGIPKKFSDFMIVAENGIDGMFKALLTSLSLDEENKKSLLGELRDYTEAHSWSDEALRLFEFCEAIKGGKR